MLKFEEVQAPLSVYIINSSVNQEVADIKYACATWAGLLSVILSICTVSMSAILRTCFGDFSVFVLIVFVGFYFFSTM